MLKVAVTWVVLLALGLATVHVAGQKCSTDLNLTQCVYCNWKNHLQEYINNTFGSLSGTKFNITVCIANTSVPGNAATNLRMTFNSTKGTVTNETTCPRGITTTTTATTTGTTTTTATTATTPPQAAGLKASNLDKSAETFKNESMTQTPTGQELSVRIYTISQPGGFGSAEKPLFESKTTATKVSNVQLRDVPADGATVVIIGDNKRITGPVAINAKSIKPANSPNSVTYPLFPIGRMLCIAAFPNKGDVTKEIVVASTAFELDISGSPDRSYIDSAYSKSGRSDDKKYIQSIAYKCVFFDQSNALNESGCTAGPNPTSGKLKCKCNHATVFAALISAKVVTIPRGVKMVTYVVEVVAIIFLIMTIALLVKVRNRVRGDRVKVQICLASCLLGLHVVSVLHDAALQNNTLCEIWAVLTHFFLLSSAMWMLMEGLTLLFKTMDSVMRLLSGANAKKFATFRYVIGFTVPVIIVTITAAVGLSKKPKPIYMPIEPFADPNVTYGKYQHCWLGSDMLIGAVVIPVAVILFSTLLIVARMFYIVYRMSSESENYKPTEQRASTGEMEIMDLKHIKAALKATMVLLPVLGLPWFLGFFTAVENGYAQVTFMYLNVIVNGLQGVMLFFVYCVLGKDVRKAVQKSMARSGYNFPSISLDKRRMTTTEHSFSHTAGPTCSTNLHDGNSIAENNNSSSDGKSAAATDKL